MNGILQNYNKYLFILYSMISYDYVNYSHKKISIFIRKVIDKIYILAISEFLKLGMV